MLRRRPGAAASELRAVALSFEVSSLLETFILISSEKGEKPQSHEVIVPRLSQVFGECGRVVNVHVVCSVSLAMAALGSRGYDGEVEVLAVHVLSLKWLLAFGIT